MYEELGPNSRVHGYGVLVDCTIPRPTNGPDMYAEYRLLDDTFEPDEDDEEEMVGNAGALDPAAKAARANEAARGFVVRAFGRDLSAFPPAAACAAGQVWRFHRTDLQSRLSHMEACLQFRVRGLPSPQCYISTSSTPPKKNPVSPFLKSRLSTF